PTERTCRHAPVRELHETGLRPRSLRSHWPESPSWQLTEPIAKRSRSRWPSTRRLSFYASRSGQVLCPPASGALGNGVGPGARVGFEEGQKQTPENRAQDMGSGLRNRGPTVSHRTRSAV